jgi:hypothetical protein
MTKIGLLAYGSLRWDPDEPLREELSFREATTVRTPFPVEFARLSVKTRASAPTLVPVEGRGGPVTALLVPFSTPLSLGQAQTVVWRRESRRGDGAYRAPTIIGPNTIVVERLEERYEGFDDVITVRLPAHDPPLEVDALARFAICSARDEVGAQRKDGISYLAVAKKHGIATPLTPAYEAAILEQLSVSSLDEAWRVARSQGNH